MVALITGALVYHLIPEKVKIKEKLVTQVQERVRTVTVIKESPDGTKVTSITEAKDTEFKQESSKIQEPVEKDWLLSTGVSLKEQNAYTFQASRRFLRHLYIGGYYSKSEYGILFTYIF